MENEDWKAIKGRIKKLAKLQEKGVKDILSFWKLTQPGFDKRIQSENFPYSRHVHELAEFLNCKVSDITGVEPQPEVDISAAKDKPAEYMSLSTLKVENDYLKQIISKQEKEIEFLREILMKK